MPCFKFCNLIRRAAARLPVVDEVSGCTTEDARFFCAAASRARNDCDVSEVDREDTDTVSTDWEAAMELLPMSLVAATFVGDGGASRDGGLGAFVATVLCASAECNRDLRLRRRSAMELAVDSLSS